MFSCFVLQSAPSAVVLELDKLRKWYNSVNDTQSLVIECGLLVCDLNLLSKFVFYNERAFYRVSYVFHSRCIAVVLCRKASSKEYTIGSDPFRYEKSDIKMYRWWLKVCLITSCQSECESEYVKIWSWRLVCLIVGSPPTWNPNNLTTGTCMENYDSIGRKPLKRKHLKWGVKPWKRFHSLSMEIGIRKNVILKACWPHCGVPPWVPYNLKSNQMERMGGQHSTGAFHKD